MKNLIPVEWSNQRVLTTRQLAQVYNVETSHIRNNFKCNRKYFIEGVHYFKVAGKDLQLLREQITDVFFSYGGNALNPLPKGGNVFTLWTAQGIFLHAKLLNTPKAWSLFGEVGAEITAPVLEKLIFGVGNALVEEQEAFVYALQMSNQTVKIGVSGNLEQRTREITRAKKLTVEKTFQTDYMPRAQAFHLEKVAHTIFADKRAEGEYFNITFEEAVETISARHCKMINTDEAWKVFTELENFYFNHNAQKPSPEVPTDLQEEVAALKAEVSALEEEMTGLKVTFEEWLGEMHKRLPEERAERLVALAEKISLPEARDKVLLHAANILVGRKIF